MRETVDKAFAANVCLWFSTHSHTIAARSPLRIAICCSFKARNIESIPFLKSFSADIHSQATGRPEDAVLPSLATTATRKYHAFYSSYQPAISEEVTALIFYFGSMLCIARYC
ncbi:hypothetical protein C8R41DRAFT_137831 [Lentinula lateritia]|uniref:Uncharacterized protein n=1 Tax=Lentinula lateritia TaxID=40482 RepID=A0ABQ8VQ42_9AGAR|nr:hypothetical protein C8R41DRAFT_137831 [Lentinula lateritia]